MRKFILSCLLLVGLALAACNGATTAPTATPTTAATTAPQSKCQVAGLLPPVDAKLPAVRDSDWAEGPKGAPLTIIEYSDYQ